MKRRQALAGLGVSFAGALSGANVLARKDAAVKAQSQLPPGSCVLTVHGDEGPFYFDSKLVRSDVTEKKPGVPLELVIQVVAAGDCTKIEGARADLWQADALGVYSGYDKQRGIGVNPTISTMGQTFLRGTQFTDRNGIVTFNTIYPSWYRGRTPHIHFKVFLERKDVVTNQIIFPEEINDRVFQRYAPYSAHVKERDMFNANDIYLKRDGSGVLCQVAQHGDRYRATLLVGVRRA